MAKEMTKLILLLRPKGWLVRRSLISLLDLRLGSESMKTGKFN